MENYLSHPCIPVYEIGETVYILENDTDNVFGYKITEGTVDKITVTVHKDDIYTKYRVIGVNGDSWTKSEPMVFESVEDLKNKFFQLLKDL